MRLNVEHIDLIKYGNGLDYIPDWNFEQAYREIIQNFIDYSDEGKYEIIEDNGYIFICNNFKPDTLEFLRIGFSDKRGTNKRGKHGEGLKMAMLVLHRMGIDSDIAIKHQNILLKPTTYKDDNLGECFGFDKFRNNLWVDENTKNYNFIVSFEKTSDFEELNENFFLKDEDIIFNCPSGRIVNHEKGKIYVGGIYITQMNDLSYAYDLNPSSVTLGRDRTIPSTFDIEYHCSKINSAYIESKDEEIELDDLNIDNRDFNYIDSLPEKIIEDVEPQDTQSGNIQFVNIKTGKTLPSKLNSIFFNNDRINDKIVKLKQVLIEKISPYDLLKEFESKHKWSLDNIGQIELQNIVTKSLNWVEKK